MQAAAGYERWELYRVLSEPVRLRMLALTEEEELTIGELAELLGESQPNVSRHVAPLKQAGLVVVRRQGTRALVRLAEAAGEDPVVIDALGSGRALCEEDGSMANVAVVLAARDAVGREYFAQVPPGERAEERAFGPPEELASYLSAFAPLLPHRALAVDAGTGDGGMLDVLAPVFTRVVAVDRAEPQLRRARARVLARGYANVDLVHGDLDSVAVRDAVGQQADAVFAVRMLHHAPQPGSLVKKLAHLARPGGAVVLLDYARHDDERMRAQADLWLGFEARELARFAKDAGLEAPHVARIPAPHAGPDAHLPWQALIATTSSASSTSSGGDTKTDRNKKDRKANHG